MRDPRVRWDDGYSPDGCYTVNIYEPHPGATEGYRLFVGAGGYVVEEDHWRVQLRHDGVYLNGQRLPPSVIEALKKVSELEQVSRLA